MGLKNFSGPDDDNSSGGAGGPIGMFPMPVPPGQSPASDDLLIDYNERFKNADPTRFREALIEQTLSVLIGKNKPNALLVGAAGVGKTKIAEDIARRIAIDDPLIPAQLKDHTVSELPLSALVAGSGIVGALEAKLLDIIAFAADPANKVILFIDEIHLLAQRSDTYSKIAQILKPALARGELRVIAATTAQEARSLDDDPAFSRRFSRLVVDELSPEQTLDVLHSVRGTLSAHYQHQITVSDDVLSQIVVTADRTSRAELHRPDNAITLLDRAMADRVLEQRRLLEQATRAGDTALVTFLQSSPSVPLTESRIADVARRLLTGNATPHAFDVNALQQDLTQTIHGQDDAIARLVDRLSRETLSLFPRNTPIAWLFAGASGVGKTETAKIISRHVTDQEPIILNMTEFHSPASVQRIIGSPAGYVGFDSNAELPLDALESNPHRLVLLDEFEKADMAVQRLFLAALDEGFMKTSRGRRIDFSKAIVVATTNAAREKLSGSRMGFGDASTALTDQSLARSLAEHFDAELLGRFSLMVGFRPIDRGIFQRIVAGEYQTQRERIVTEQPALTSLLPADMPADDQQAVTEASYVDAHGARPARRAVRVWIEDRVLAAKAQGPAPSVASATTQQDPGEED